MVKLTTKYLLRQISKKNQLCPRKKDETDLDYLNRLTHLRLQSQFIEKIAPLPECQLMSVIYLQNNLLQNIQNLNNFPRLTHLYLQHNYISKIENINCLTSLKKLYLSYNEISVIEGLEDLKNLTELHVENQRLPPGETLYFDPKTMFYLGKSLKVLNISNNNIDSIGSLESLMSLSKLLVEGNKIKNEKEFAESLSCLSMLEELNTEGNPIAANRKHLDVVVLACPLLRVLNGKPILEQTRTFITNLSNNLDNRKRLSEFSMKALDSDESFPHSEGYANRSDLVELKVGSKLFPILKEIAKGNPRIIKISSKKSSTSLTPVLSNSLKVKRLNDTRSFYY